MDAGNRGPAAPDQHGNRVSVEIYGEQYTVRGDADEAYVRDIAKRLDQRMRELAARRPQFSSSQLAVLTALNALDELARLESQYHRVLALFEREWERRRHEAGGAASQLAAGADASRARAGGAAGGGSASGPRGSASGQQGAAREGADPVAGAPGPEVRGGAER